MPGHMKRQIAEPYEIVAEIYDQLMEHVDYKQWSRYIKTLLSSNLKSYKHLADLSCGTGSFLSQLKINAANITGSDLSQAMIKQARQKNYLCKANFATADFRKPPYKNEIFDAVLVLYDSINYLLDEDQIQRFLSEASRILRPGGILIFDAVMPYVCKTDFKDYQESQQITDDVAYNRRSWFDSVEGIQYNEFTVYLNGQTFEELHEQKIWSVRQWKQMLKKSPFKLVDVFANFTFRAVQRKTERAHFVCRKPDKVILQKNSSTG